MFISLSIVYSILFYFCIRPNSPITFNSILEVILGNYFMRDCSKLAPQPHPIIASSITMPMDLISTISVLVQLYPPEKFFYFSIHSVPPTHNHLPLGKHLNSSDILKINYFSFSFNFPNFSKPLITR